MAYSTGPHLQSSGIEAPSFRELAVLAVDRLLKGPRPLCVVCGPITSGGTGNQMHNFEIFNAVVQEFERLGKQIFNQIPYEYGLRKLAHAWEAQGNTGYCLPILSEFYEHIFECGVISEGFFIPGWRWSIGARWEREKLVSLGCATHDLTHAEVRRCLMYKYEPEYVEVLMSELGE